ncbi:MAG TPA: multicopper oxidase domain-containing protein, partial [Gaiellaceae bacterium]
MAYPATEKLPARPGAYAQEESSSGALVKIVALLLGLLVGVLAIVAVLMWADAHGDKTVAPAATAPATAPSMPGMAGPQTATAEGAYATPSFAGLAPANADTLAAAHAAYPAELPALTAGPVVSVSLGISHRVIQVAPGIKYDAWTFDGGVPGPVVHARQGQTVEVTLTNNSPMPHSIDFHAAQVAPNLDFVDVLPGKSFTFSFKADVPGVFMYHCGTKPVLAHIANGMYGAIVVDPADSSLLPPA